MFSQGKKYQSIIQPHNFKENSSIQERIKRSILGSPCFDKLKSMHQDLDKYLKEKLVPIEGDLEKARLNLSPNDEHLLTENVQIVINCAVMFDFDARLDDAIKINVRGPQKLLELAKRMEKLENFVHISTAYVNADKKGVIEEKIYPIEVNPEVIIKDIEMIPTTQIEARTASIIGNYPNTYSFTRAMGERILERNREKVPLTIVRPSLIGCSWMVQEFFQLFNLKEPFPGWIDSVSAAAALYLYGGIGLIKVARGDPNVICDQIPVDICADTIVVATAVYAKSKEINVIHASSSATNPTTWGFSTDIVNSYWEENPPESRISPCTLHLEKNETKLKLKQSVRLLPVLGYRKIAKFIDHTEMKKNSTKTLKELKRGEQLSNILKPVLLNEWIFVNSHLDDLQQFCEEEPRLFCVNPKEIQWKKYFLYFAWGLRYFILKEQCDTPAQGDRSDVLASSGGRKVSTFQWIFSRGYDFKPTDPEVVRKKIMNSARLKNVIRDIIVNKSTNMSDTEFENYLFKVAQKNCDFILSKYNLKWIKFAGLILHSVLKTIYEKIVVDEKALDKIKSMDYKRDGPIILMPTHRSYLDFILASYIFYSYSIQCPHIVAAEDFLNMALVHHIMRGSGALFIRRKKTEYMEIYWAVLYEYIQSLILDQCWLEFFIEGTRCRYGKTLAPKLGILSMITDAIFDGKLHNAQIIPMTISYERIIEGDAFPYELLGEEKKKESTGRLLGALGILKMNFGRVYIELADPIPLTGYIEKYMQKNPKIKDPYKNVKERQPILESLGYEIVYQLNDNLIILPTGMVAAILLLHRKGISEENLLLKLDWLKKQILDRGGRIGGIDENSTLKTVTGATVHLQHLIDQKKDMLHPIIHAKPEYKNVLMLAYYRNTLLHVFWLEALLACALSSFGQEMAWKDGVSIERLWEELSFLSELMIREVQLRTKLNRDTYPGLLKSMIERKILKENDGKITVADDTMIVYLTHLIWPFVESYWVTAVYLFNIKSRNTPTYEVKFIQEVQMFTESMFEEKVIEFYEACSIDTIKNANVMLKKWKIINATRRELESGQKSDVIIELAISEDALKLLQDHIRRFLKNSFAKSVSSPIELARKTVLIDYPFMAKM